MNTSKARVTNRKLSNLVNKYTTYNLSPRRKDKFNTRWSIGTYSGHMDETGEIIIGTPEGMQKVRTIKRQALKCGTVVKHKNKDATHEDIRVL